MKFHDDALRETRKGADPAHGGDEDAEPLARRSGFSAILVELGDHACQVIGAAVVRPAIALMTPDSTKMSLAMQADLEARVAKSEQHYQLRITRARCE